MHFERRSHYSGHLNREMHFNVYGHAGKPVIVFPSSGGSQNEFADFGMIEACRSFIDRGLIKFYTPDSLDNESWLATSRSPHDIGETHNQYDRYIIEELVPLIRYESNWGGAMITTGCSMGGFHTTNFALRHPDIFDISIALSGVCVGQGDWEGPHILATRELQHIFESKRIPGWFDYWGHDIPHDWDAWRNQLPYFFGALERQGKI